MREMKDSGVKWIGAIPTDWQVDNPKYHFTQRKDRAQQGMVQLTASQKHGVITQTEYMERTGANIVTVQKDFDILKLVCAGDFVIHMRSFQGGLEYSEKTGSISSAYVMLIPGETICEPRYYKWFFKSSNYIDALSSTSNLVRDGQAMRWANFIQLPIAFPPAAEQKRIANFLDVKCSEIDALIADVQAQIDVLEQYKRSSITEAVTRGIRENFEVEDSRVFYMGPINKNWTLSKIGYICKKLAHTFQPEDTALICSNKGKVLVRDSGLTGIMVSEDNAMQGIRKGDIAIHGMDTWHGAIALSEMDGKITRVVHVCDSTEDKRFVVYWLQHLAFQGVYKLISNGVRGNTSDFRSWDKVSDIYIPIPTRQEQAEICDYLDHICKEVDAIAETKKKQLTVLEAYKKSLIFEYVTGKKEVPAVESAVTAVAIDPHVILAGKVIDLLGDKLKGKTQIQKLLYLIDNYLGLNLTKQYYRYPHGPYDCKLDHYFDVLVENSWFKKVPGDAEKYEKGRNHAEFCNKYKDAFADHSQDISSLISFVKDMKRTSQIERIATIFAVWNDLILDGNLAPTDDEIIHETLTHWTPNKAKTAEDTWKGTLAKMKKQGIIPKGQGLHTLPMPQRGVNNA